MFTPRTEQFMFNSTTYCLNKLRVSYNNSCRRLLRLPMRNSASGMFVQCKMLSFGGLLRKSILAFRGRIQSSNNSIIKRMVNSVAPLVSNVWKWWRTTLYTGNVTVQLFVSCMHVIANCVTCLSMYVVYGLRV